MKIIWLVFMVIIILRSVGILMKRSGYRGKYDAPREELSFNAEDLLLESTPAGEPVESEPELDLPEYQASRGSDLTVISNDSRYEGRQEGPARERRPDRGRNIDYRRELDGRCGMAELFDGGISQREFIKGMVWSQILGLRGGIQASKRSRYRYQ